MVDYKSIIARLRSVSSRSKGQLLREAADAIETLSTDLAYYEDTEEQGRLVVFPNVAERDRQNFIDGLHDYFNESAFKDRSVGISGITEGEKVLANALMEALKGGAE